jgi:hypothetical protein
VDVVTLIVVEAGKFMKAAAARALPGVPITPIVLGVSYASRVFVRELLHQSVIRVVEIIIFVPVLFINTVTELAGGKTQQKIVNVYLLPPVDLPLYPVPVVVVLLIAVVLQVAVGASIALIVDLLVVRLNNAIVYGFVATQMGIVIRVLLKPKYYAVGKQLLTTLHPPYLEIFTKAVPMVTK